MARHRADANTGGVVAPQNGELAQNGEFPPFHLGRIILVHMVIPHKVKQPVHQHEPALLNGRISEIRSLRGDDLGAKDDVPQLEGVLLPRAIDARRIRMRERPWGIDGRARKR